MAGKSSFSGAVYGGSGTAFVAGHWRADQASGKIAIPEGPQGPRAIAQHALPPAERAAKESRERMRADHAAALAPRRWSPS